MNSTTLEQAREAKPRATEMFRQLAEVVGVGITRIGGGYGLKVNLRQHPGEQVTLPEAVDGVPVKVEVLGTIRAC